MTNRNEDKLSMYEKVQLFLNNHISTLSSIIANTAVAKTDFDQKIQDLMNTIASAGMQTTGYTQIKENARLQLETSLLKIMRGLKAVAIDNNYLDLKAKSAYTRTDVERMRDSEIYTTTLRILDLTQTYQTQLTNYAITSINLQDLKNYNNAFFAVIQLPKDKIGERASYNQLIELQMASVDALLKERLDVYMDLIEFDFPQLYAQYKSARAIDTSGGNTSNKTYIGLIMAGLTAVIVKQDYNADRTYTFMNKGNGDLQFGLSLDGISISGTILTLQSGDEITRDASDLSGAGDFLIVYNNGSIDGSYKVDADK